MFYQQLTIPIHELENKKQMKCNFWSPEQKIDTEVTLYPNKNGTVADLLVEAKNHCKLAANGTGSLRLLEIQSHKIFSICRAEVKIENLTGSHTKSYRIEEIPADQVSMS
jgi:ubiquitin carboxyl-terminal hydrolase 7